MKTIEANTNETVAILTRQVEKVLILIQNLKKRTNELESDNKVLVAENKRLKSDIAQHSERVKSYEEKLKTLEDLLDEAQKDQSYLEQSILNAISNLKNIDELSMLESKSEKQHTRLEEDEESSYNAGTHHESVSIHTESRHTEVDSEAELDMNEAEEKEQVGIF